MISKPSSSILLSMLESSETGRIVLLSFLLAAAALIVYSNSLGASFQFDDFSSIVENPLIRRWDDLWAFWRAHPARSLLNWTFALNYRLGGPKVIGYHLVNLAIHLGNSLLTFHLVRLMLGSPALASRLSPGARGVAGCRTYLAFLTALIFALHPVQTQAVTYIVQRAESLAAFFYLLTLVLYVRARQGVFSAAPARPPLGSWLLYGTSLASALLGALTKETVASLPGALLLYELCFLPGSWWGRGGRLPWLLPFFAPAIAVWWLATGGSLSPPAQPEALPRWSYLLTQFRVLVTYLRLLFLPLGQNLDYDYRPSHSLGEPEVLTCLLLLGSLLALGIYAFRRWPLLSFGILWFFLTLSVTSSVVPIQDVIFEHRLYLAVLGYGLLWAQVALGVLQRVEGKVGPSMGLGGPGWKPLLAAGLSLVIAYGWGTYERNKVWKDELTLWGDCVRKSPHKARPYANWGRTLGFAGRYAEALEALHRAKRLRPDPAGSLMIFLNLGNCYLRLGKHDDALREFQAVLQEDSDNLLARSGLGFAYQGLGQWDQAIREHQKALELNPAFPPAYRGLALACEQKGGLEELAERAWKRYLQFCPPDGPEAREVRKHLRSLGQKGISR